MTSVYLSNIRKHRTFRQHRSECSPACPYLQLRESLYLLSKTGSTISAGLIICRTIFSQRFASVIRCHEHIVVNNGYFRRKISAWRHTIDTLSVLLTVITRLGVFNTGDAIAAAPYCGYNHLFFFLFLKSYHLKVSYVRLRIRFFT